MAPTWLTVLAWISLAAAFVSAALIAVDVFVKGHRGSTMLRSGS